MCDCAFEKFIKFIRENCGEWDYVWFRGEHEYEKPDAPLIPQLYRPRKDGRQYNENRLLQSFRLRAPAYASPSTLPDRKETDKWLFLARHVGLPTRILDWTESALVALYFALQNKKEGDEQRLSIVWMLNPIELNLLSLDGEEREKARRSREFPLTWHTSPGKINIGWANISAAWENDSRGTRCPVAVYPAHVHARMSAQKSVFTVHGKKKESLVDLVEMNFNFLKSFEIQPEDKEELRNELRRLGIRRTTVWPDLDKLAQELEELCLEERCEQPADEEESQPEMATILNSLFDALRRKPRDGNLAGTDLDSIGLFFSKLAGATDEINKLCQAPSEESGPLPTDSGSVRGVSDSGGGVKSTSVIQGTTGRVETGD